MGLTAAQIAENLAGAVAGEAKALVLDIANELRRAPPLGTPVQTGHARRNWIPSVGAPHEGEIDSDGEFEAGIAAVLAYQLGEGPLFVANSAPYISALNDGTSKQAPAGFVEVAVDRALAKAQAKQGRHIDISAIRQAFAAERGAAAAGNMAEAYSPFGGD